MSRRHVETRQIHFSQLFAAAETMIADYDEKRLLEVRCLACLLEKLAERPVRVAHGGQMLIQRSCPVTASTGSLSGKAYGVWFDKEICKMA